MKGYKIFGPDWKCRDLQYTPGETAIVDGPPVVCTYGLHFCKRAIDCLEYYPLAPMNKYAEVRADGDIITHDDKSVTNVLHVVRELTYKEFQQLCTCEEVEWHSTGFQASSFNYVDGLLDGLCKEWYNNGNIKRVVNYKDGLQHGPCTSWTRDGNKMVEHMYDHGINDGQSTYWDPYGTINFTVKYKMGWETSRTNYDEFGEPTTSDYTRVPYNSV